MGLAMTFQKNQRHEPRKIHQLDLKVKMSALRYDQENERTNHRLGENVCKRHSLIRDVSKIHREPVKLNNRNQQPN